MPAVQLQDHAESAAEENDLRHLRVDHILVHGSASWTEGGLQDGRGAGANILLYHATFFDANFDTPLVNSYPCFRF